jgi:hypothetical protein
MIRPGDGDLTPGQTPTDIPFPTKFVKGHNRVVGFRLAADGGIRLFRRKQPGMRLAFEKGRSLV